MSGLSILPKTRGVNNARAVETAYNGRRTIVTSSDPIAAVIHKARRRFVRNEAAAQAVISGCLVLAGVILILLLGTQLLQWAWLLPLALGGALFAGYRTVRRTPSRYSVAQWVDRRLDLQDSLSTALFFLDPGDRHGDGQTRAAQRAMAEGLAPQVDPSSAVPFTLPRGIWALAALALIAAGLFTTRYLIEKRLDLRAPLAQVIFDTFGGRFERRVTAKNQKKPSMIWESPTPDTPTTEAHPEEPGKFDAAPDSVLDTVDVPDVNNDKIAAEEGPGKSSGKSAGKEPGDGERAEGDPGENMAEAAGREGQGSAERDGAGSMQADNQGGKQPPSSSGENPSLASKLRDAMSNLLSRMRPQSSAGANKQSPTQQKGPQSGQQQASLSQKGAAAQQNQPGGDQAGDSQDGDTGDEARGGENSDGKSSGKGSEEHASKNPGSGMGKQDGSKDVKLAEQMAAMGKISEIIGKRSQNVTGEVTIEVQSTKQQLRTPYSDSKAGHGQAGGEINRDEVPAAAQEYVQRYFEKVRKTAPAPPPASPSGSQ